MLYGLDREFPAVAVVNLGPDPKQETAQYEVASQMENRDLAKENLRCGIAGIVPCFVSLSLTFLRLFVLQPA